MGRVKATNGSSRATQLAAAMPRAEQDARSSCLRRDPTPSWSPKQRGNKVALGSVENGDGLRMGLPIERQRRWPSTAARSVRRFRMLGAKKKDSSSAGHHGKTGFE